MFVLLVTDVVVFVLFGNEWWRKKRSDAEKLPSDLGGRSEVAV